MKTLGFTQLEGCGNNFIVMQDLQRNFVSTVSDLSHIAARIQDRHFGVGSDGLMIVVSSTDADFEVLMFNPDGSRMGMCGNGIRCVTRFLFLEGIVARHVSKVEFLVQGRRIICYPIEEGRSVRVDMGTPSFAAAAVPVLSAQEFIEQPIPQHPWTGTCLSMGNPHCVIFVDDLDKIQLEVVGPVLEHHAIFPERANIEFVRCLSPERCQARVWERGAGITLACGTGACAVLMAGYRSGRLAPHALVELPGGVLDVEYQPDANKVFLTGPAREICTGEFSPDFLSRIS